METKTKIPIFFFLVAIVLLVAIIVAVAGFSFQSSGLVFVAEELTEKPDKYIPLTEPDPYVLQAISNPGKEVVVGAWKNSEFNEMVSTYKTNNVEIDGRYYRINEYSKDVFIWGVLFLLSIMGWVALGIVVIVWKLIMHTHSE